jgi:DNA-binding IclR family transcriptional regulator
MIRDNPNFRQTRSAKGSNVVQEDTASTLPHFPARGQWAGVGAHRSPSASHHPMSSPPDSTASERQGIQVIARMAALLRALQNHSEGISLGQLAKAIDLPRSTVQRIVDALDNEGLVIAASASHGVRLGPAILALAAATKFHIAEVARETLEELSKECGETVDLSILDQDKVVFIDQVSGKQRLTAVSAVGVAFPLHASANGKALLAAMSAEELAKVRASLMFKPLTPNTLMSWDELERQLEDIRRSGLAFDLEENAQGICAVATALRDPSGELAAISIPTPAFRFEVQREALSSALLKHAQHLQQRLAR